MLKGFVFFCLIACLNAQQPAAPAPAQPPALKERPAAVSEGIQVDPGTHILLNMINSINTKQTVVGDRLYLETAFPVIVNGKIVVPQGSWVTGTVTEVRRPGRVKGRGELAVRFDSLTLPNGVTRSFRADIGALDARNEGKLDRENNKIKGPGDKSGDAQTMIRTTAEGAAIGTGVGAAAGHIGAGSVIGLAGGAAGGLIGILASRGPDATLPRGSTVEMVLDRPLIYTPSDLDLTGAPAHAALSEGTLPPPKKNGWNKATSPF
jgi:hypothetical protein